MPKQLVSRKLGGDIAQEFTARSRRDRLGGGGLLQADRPAIGGQQRRVGGLEVIRATAKHRIHEQLPLGSGKIVRRTEPGCRAGRRQRGGGG